MKSVIALLVILFAGVCCCQADDAPTAPDAIVYDLGNGLNGTPAQIAKKLNISIEQAWTHYQDKVQAAQLKQSQVDAETAAIVKTVKATGAYKQKSTEATAAAAELKVCRDQEDSSGALDAGSRMNLAKAALKQMEDSALKADPRLSSDRAYLIEYTRQQTEAQTALTKAAKWRARITTSLRSSAQLQWPLVTGEQFCLNQVKVDSIQGRQLTVVSFAEEPVEGTVQKNARGDGIDLATFTMHPVKVMLDIPEGAKPRMDAALTIKGSYKIVGDIDLSADVPLCHAQRDDTGALGTLLNTLDAVKGPPREFLDKIDDQVTAEEAKAIDEINRKNNPQP